MPATITPDNIHVTLFGLMAGPFIVLVLIELALGRALRPGRFWHLDDRETEPFDYWLNVLTHLAVIGFFVWLCFFKLATPATSEPVPPPNRPVPASENQ